MATQCVVIYKSVNRTTGEVANNIVNELLFHKVPFRWIYFNLPADSANPIRGFDSAMIQCAPFGVSMNIEIHFSDVTEARNYMYHLPYSETESREKWEPIVQGILDKYIVSEPIIDPTTGKPAASFILRDRHTKEAKAEVISQSVAEKVNKNKYEAVPVGQHLNELSARGKAPANGPVWR